MYLFTDEQLYSLLRKTLNTYEEIKDFDDTESKWAAINTSIEELDEERQFVKQGYIDKTYYQVYATYSFQVSLGT
jgi:hypothetical protein